jgi:hypothetical protein
MTIQMVITDADQALFVEGRFQWAIEGPKARRLIARYRHHLRKHGVEAAAFFSRASSRAGRTPRTS